MRTIILCIPLTAVLALACGRARSEEPRQPEPPQPERTVPLPVAATPADVVLHRAENGPHEFDVVRTLEIEVAHSERPLQLRVTAPRTDGPLPLLIWSHGANGSKDGYQPLVRHWASHGYAVVQPTHGDSLSLVPRAERGDLRSLVERTKSRDVSKHWRTRPLDVRAILDQLELVEGAVGHDTEREIRFDRERIAVGGHSFGARTTQLVAGAELFAPGGRRGVKFEDPRPKCFLIVSPTGIGGGLREESWTGVTRPALFISGDNDRSVVREDPPELRRKAFEFSPPGDKLMVWIADAHHGFGGIAGPIRYPTSGPANEQDVDVVQSATTAFLDAHLHDDARAKEYLAGDEMVRATEGAVELSRK